MKTNISITIDNKLLEKLQNDFPDIKRSQAFERALKYWISSMKKNSLKKQAMLLSQQEGDHDLEDFALGDGLDDL